MTMLPLVNSAEPTQLEAELKALTIALYEEFLQQTADEINLYGVPFLGDLPLIQRNTQADGLTLFRNNAADVTTKFLFKAWKFLNPKRGLHFTDAYLRALWGKGAYELDQLWQLKAGTYPNNCKTPAEIAGDGESISDYFLTSRVRADVDTLEVPDLIFQSLKSTLPARMLLIMRVAKWGNNTFGSAYVQGGASVCFASGIAS